jgi:hypothetical protein
MVEGRDVRKLIILNKGENEIKVAIAISKFRFNTSPTASLNECNLSRSSRMLEFLSKSWEIERDVQQKL